MDGGRVDSGCLIRADAIEVSGRLVYDTMDRHFVEEVLDALDWGKSVRIFDYSTRQYVTISLYDLDSRTPMLRQVNRILRAHGIRPRRVPRGRR